MIRSLRLLSRDGARHQTLLSRPANASTHFSAFGREVADSTNTVQSYVSSSDDPFFNLSFEHFLLETAPANSSVLFLYTNRPCIVVGRNQNPWLETNLNLLDPSHERFPQCGHGHSIGKVDLVRRRSGGGTVFHDQGNINWTIISPSESFTRDKHAEMIVRALRSNGIVRARVNERHDIVLDQSTNKTNTAASSDYHRTNFTDDSQKTVPLKVSGSAYKLTRGKALHHGTCLLDSPNLGRLHDYLTSLARPFISAKGVESVRSPVANVGISREVLQRTVQAEFSSLYGTLSGQNDPIVIGDELLQDEQIQSIFSELTSPAWIFDQTPQFSFATKGEAWLATAKKLNLPKDINVQLKFRHGKITESLISTGLTNSSEDQGQTEVDNKLIGRRLRDQWSWKDVISLEGLSGQQNENLGSWMQQVLPAGR